MERLILILLLAPWLAVAAGLENVNETDLADNSTDPNKDMYVIHAMVYQVGIVTNRTDNETANLNSTGNQEAVTFYNTNGSHVDLSKIANPLLTNVTAQSMVGVAPVPAAEAGPSQLPWGTLNHLANIAPSTASKDSSQIKAAKRSIKSVDVLAPEMLNTFYRSLFKRDAPGTPVAVHSGAALIPADAGVQSLALPPLLSLNRNMSDIPVPIPNTSVVHYAKINTLVSKT
ncbi:uncharacterized protein LOC113495648 [Trichoplusia ni]|uniref:Uncharacterized protein LOC113495648 n=1 Tax=Trichoplusia ni TaxID=7111 RepID=A0A7E5VPN4_TRINI|nr:uncharacterized protein LOC113495648 [Trichoplusia ni]